MGWAAWWIAVAVLVRVIWREASKADRAEQELEDRRRAWRTGK
jgi:hypothetical protein